MALDIRADVTVTIGGATPLTLISGSLSDDYLQGSGLIRTKGVMEVSGLVTPAPGTTVVFNYSKGGLTRQIPRVTRILSSFADPYRRTTTIELGCKFSYFADLEEPLNWEALDDPENAGLTEADQEIVTVPIYAKSIAAKCCTELGIDPSPVSVLTNKFSVAEFDFSGGYVQILSDLLVSESYCGYLDDNEDLQLIDLSADGGTGPVIDETQIIDLGPIGTGQLPGEAVIVEYDTLKLRSPDDDKDAKDEELLWEYAETSAEGEYQLAWTDFFSGQKFIQQYLTLSRTFTQTQYIKINDENVVSKRIQYDQKPAVAVCGSVGSEFFSYGVPFYPEAPCFSSTETTYEYDDNGEVTREETRRYVSFLEYVGQLALTYAQVENGQVVSLTIPTGTGWYDIDNDPFGFLELTSYYAGKIEIDRTVTSQSKIVVDTINPIGGPSVRLGIPVATSQTVTESYKAWPQTIQGQQAIAEAGAPSTGTWLVSDTATFVDNAISHGVVLNEVQVANGFKLTPQGRPSTADLLNAADADESGDPNNGWRTESEAEIVLALGSAEAQRRITFRMPYAPDDVFVGPSGGPFTAIVSDAEQKAITYGRVQNKLLLGNRSGMNLQLTPEVLPQAPFDPLYVQANGLTALYRANGNQWAFSSDGIAASTDALFWGAVGGTGEFSIPSNPGVIWFPVSPTVTTLPAAPAAVGGDITTTPGEVIPPYNEIIPITLRLRTVLAVTALDYPLAAEETVTLVTYTAVELGAGLVDVPAAAFSLAALPPLMSTIVNVPVGAFTLEAHAPTYDPSIVVQVPAAAFTLEAHAPSISTASVFVPAVAFALTPLTPAFSNPSETLLLHLDGSDGSTTFIDSGKNEFTITPANTAQIDTDQSKFGGASLLLSWNAADSLLTPDSAEFSFPAEFTVDLWMRPVDRLGVTYGLQTVFVIGSTTDGVFVNVNAFGDSVYVNNNNMGDIRSYLTNNVWSHLAITRDGSDEVRVFVDGTQRLNATISGTVNTNEWGMEIGREFGGGPMEGHIDEVRVRKGTAVWTSGFTPPSSPYT